MTASTSTAPDAPAAGAAPAPAQSQSGTAEAIAAARQRLAEGKPLLETGTDAGVPGAGSDEIPPEGFSVTLAGLEDRGEEPIELEAPDQETFDRLTRLQQDAVLGREVKRERGGVAQAQGELAEVEDMIAVDPTGFIMEHVPEKVRVDIATQLLFEPGVLEEVQERLRASGYEGGLEEVLGTPEAQRTLAAELKASRLEMRDQLRAQHEAGKVMQANAGEVVAEIHRLIPASVTGERRDRLFRDCILDVRDRARRLGLTQVDPRDVRLMLAHRLRELGTGGSRTPAPETRRAARPAAAGSDLPTGTAERIKLARKIGLRALVDRARATT